MTKTRKALTVVTLALATLFTGAATASAGVLPPHRHGTIMGGTHQANRTTPIPVQVDTDPPSTAKALSTAFVPNAVSVYGASFAMDNYPYIPLQADGHHGEYGRKIASHYGASVDMNARSGARLIDNIRGIASTSYAGSTAYHWQLGLDRSKTAVVLESLHLDELTGDAGYEQGVAGALREAVGAFGSASLKAPSYVGSGWTKASYPDRAAGGALWHTETFGAKMDFTVAGSSATVALIATDGAYLPYGSMKIYVNDVLWPGIADGGYWHATNKTKAYVDSVDGKSLRMWSQYGLRLMGMPPGVNKITVRKVDDTANPIAISGIYEGSSSPPRVYVAEETPRNPAATCGPCVDEQEANYPAYRVIVEDVCGEFSYCHVVDLRDGWVNPDMDATSDPYKVHPNMAGMDFLAGKFEDAIDATPNPLGKASVRYTVKP